MTRYFAPQAEADFAAIVGYLAERNAVAARELSDRIFTVIDKLAAMSSRVGTTLVPGEVDHRRSGLSRIMSP